MLNGTKELQLAIWLQKTQNVRSGKGQVFANHRMEKTTLVQRYASLYTNLHGDCNDLATLLQQPAGMAPPASVFFQCQILLSQLVFSDLLCKPHQTLLGPALPRTLFALEGVPTCQVGQFREQNVLICGRWEKV